MTNSPVKTALITGASSGIGATYANRLARRGHDVALVARDRDRMSMLGARLRAETGATIDVLPADLTDPVGLARVETRLREDDRIGLLVNNAGAAAPGGFAAPDLDTQDRLIRLNVTAVTRLAGAVLAGAVVPHFLAAGGGTAGDGAEFPPGASHRALSRMRRGSPRRSSMR